MAKARTYPKANRTTQWWESAFSRGRFDRIEKILLHTTETTGWPGYNNGAAAPTLTYHPRRREWRQHNYLDTSARALVDPTWTAVRENRDGVIQIEIICYSDAKLAATVGGLPVTQLTDDHYRDLAAFVAFVRREWGGPPLAYPPRANPRMTGPEYDAFMGILDHSDASGNTHWDAGAFDFARLIRAVKALETPTPAPTPVPEEDIMQEADFARIGDIVTAKVNAALDSVKPPDSWPAELRKDNPDWTVGYALYNIEKLLVGLQDPSKIAAAVVAALPAGQGQVTQETVEAAIRSVFGSLGNTPAQEG